jgi:general secretion pathway protein G
MPRRAGFTLLEVLIVTAVIAAILAIVIPVVQTAFHKMRVHQAQADISTLELALEGYKSKYGKYPDENPADRVPVDALEDDGGDPSTPFMKFSDKRLVSNVFIDPWNTPYYYQSPGAHQTGFVDIVSAGPDRQMDASNWSDSDNDDNIDNWSQKR